MRIIATILLIFCGLAQAQVTNIEARRVQTDTTGWYGEVNTGFKFVKEVGSVFTSNSDARVQYKTKKNLYLLLGEYNWSGASSKTNTHNAYLHLRYNRKLQPSWLRWEVFSQYQFNKITRINLRILNGTGPRFKLLERDKGLLYIGVLYMFEYTKELNKDNTILYLKEHRNSTYVSFSVFPNDFISILSTSYYQPRLDKWKDYRVSNITELRAKISKRFYIGMAYKLNFDTYPSEGISPVTHSFENKIGVSF
ncbi:MAG TPA: DUF481 domain-containing protein [Chitinophagales bacterium]|nr:DUF481 domain-containing protein [Chitinophagales bacterium]